MHPAMRKAKQGVAQQIAGGIGQVQALAGELADAFQAMAEGRPPRIEELAMADVVGFFVEHRKSVPEAEAAAILRELRDSEKQTDPGHAEHLVRLFFLDKNGRPLLRPHQPTREYLVRQFDSELAGAFGTNNIVIFS